MPSSPARRLERVAGVVVDAAGRADREHALRLAPAQRHPQRVGPGLALDDHAVPVGDGDRRRGRRSPASSRHGGQAGGDDGVAVGGRDERAARLPQRALAGERPDVTGRRRGRAHAGPAAQAEEGELDQRTRRGPEAPARGRTGEPRRGSPDRAYARRWARDRCAGVPRHMGSGPSPRVVGDPALGPLQRALTGLSGPPRRLNRWPRSVARLPAVRWWDSRAVKGDGL